MAQTYTLISSSVLTSATANLTFSSIPATYTDLVLRMSLKSSAAATAGSMYLTFNGTAAAYSFTKGTSDGTTLTAALANSGTAIFWTNSVEGTDAAVTNTFSSNEIYISSYASTTVGKVLTGFSAQENNATAAYLGISTGMWENNAAITSITLNTNGNNWAIDSSFYLYGISNA